MFAGAVVDIIIAVQPFSGVGPLGITVTWPEGVLINPELSGSNTELVFSTATDSLSSSFICTYYCEVLLANGYYTLSLWLSADRSDGSGRDIVWGTVEALRIITGQMSSKTFELVEDVNRGGIAIQNEMSNPFEVAIFGVDPEILKGSVLIAIANPAGADSYEWYLDGFPLLNDGVISLVDNEITISGDIELGHHWLSVVVTEDSVLSSTSIEFDVSG